MDLGIEVILKLFSQTYLDDIFTTAEEQQSISSDNAQRIYVLRNEYLKTINDVVLFLQGKNHTLARQICSETFLPQASRFDQLDDLDWAFGSMGMQDKAKHLATLYLEDLSDFIKECIDENFGFSRYAERLGMSANSFDELHEILGTEITYIDEITIAILEERLETIKPKLVCLSVPFPGNLYSAFRCAQFIKDHYPDISVSMGGGFPNTELRSVSDPRVFEFFDFITLDDGELPVELLANYVLSTNSAHEFKRTFYLKEGKVVYDNSCKKADYKQSVLGTPDYSDLQLNDYISVIEIANPMHSLWSDGRWNKLTMAHGCYWGKCTFCDISLDYIKLYEPIAAKILVDRIEELIAQTGETGFHFVDEAAPPALMREVALEILKRNLTISWWTNIRFEKSFTWDLCRLLKASGCIAVSGGLEVASDRLLELIDKGVTVEQVAQVTNNFTESGIMVHAYLMYGYPTQTIQETVDSLEMVRQLFEAGVLQSGFWHQFAMTAHSPVGMEPESYGVTPHKEKITFANNDVQFTHETGIDHNQFSAGLKKSLFNYMHGVGFDFPLQDWFDFDIPDSEIEQDYIINCLSADPSVIIKATSKLLWLGSDPITSITYLTKKGREIEALELFFHSAQDSFSITIEKKKGDWLCKWIAENTLQNGIVKTLADFQLDYEKTFDGFDVFWHSKPIHLLRENGLLVI